MRSLFLSIEELFPLSPFKVLFSSSIMQHNCLSFFLFLFIHIHTHTHPISHIIKTTYKTVLTCSQRFHTVCSDMFLSQPSLTFFSNLCYRSFSLRYESDSLTLAQSLCFARSLTCCLIHCSKKLKEHLIITEKQGVN